MSKFATLFMMKYVIVLSLHTVCLAVELEVLLEEGETLLMVLSQDTELRLLQHVDKLQDKNVKMYPDSNARTFLSKYRDKNARMFQDSLVEMS